MKRINYLKKIEQAFKVNPAVALLGPRQCGKTTLAKLFAQAKQPVHLFDLEDPEDLAKLETPKLTLEPLDGLIVLDEIQRKSNLFTVLRVLIDKKNRKQPYLILGSASRDLINQSSETLAGRISYVELTPFTLTEVDEIERLWIRGGFPLSYLAEDLNSSNAWRRSFIQTFLERDIPNLGFKIAPQNLRRFWMMLVHYHGQTFNAAEIGKSLGISHTAVNNYLRILSGTFMVRVLTPWIENIKKRQVKSPKIYFRDTGILHSLIGINNIEELHTHPKLGASWEGFALEEIIRYHQADAEDCYFWSLHSGAELDLLIIKDGKRLGFEFKYTDSPKLTKSMRTAFETLDLDQLTLIYPGHNNFLLAENGIRASGLMSYTQTT